MIFTIWLEVWKELRTLDWIDWLIVAACSTVIFLAGCVSIGHEPPPTDWPKLKVVEHHVPHAVMRDRCMQYVNGLMTLGTVEACAEWHFSIGECHLWFSADFPPSRGIIQHERQHCEGRDHHGETTARDAWERFKGAKR